MSKIEEIEKLKSLLDSKAISKEQYDLLLNNLIGINKTSKEQELLESGAINKEQYDLLLKQKHESEQAEGEIISPDDSEDNITMICNKKWVNNCLKTEVFESGDIVPKINNESLLIDYLNSEKAGIPEFIIDNKYASKNGFLYTKGAILSSKKLIPDGYRIPTYEDWKEVFLYHGMNEMENDLSVGNYLTQGYSKFVNPNKSFQSLFSQKGGIIRTLERKGLFRKEWNFAVCDETTEAGIYAMEVIKVDFDPKANTMTEFSTIMGILIEDNYAVPFENVDCMYVKLIKDDEENTLLREY